MNDYGYGWIYWFPMYLLTYLPKILFEKTGIAWLLLVLPRMQSLFFGVLCSFLSYKIASVFTKNEWIKMVIVLLMPLFPTGGYFAGRFGTINQVAFFSMLSVWLILRNQIFTARDLRISLLAFAVAMGTKISAIVVAPMLILLILNRYNWKLNFTNVKVWIKESFIAFIAMIFFISPAIIIFPFAKQQALASIKLVFSYAVNNQNIGNFLNFIENIKYTYFDIVGYVLIALSFLALIWSIKNLKYKKDLIYKDYICIFSGYFIGIIYLALTITTGKVYSFSYATSISFALPLGIIFVEHIPFKKEKIKKSIVILSSIVLLFLQISFIIRLCIQPQNNKVDNIAKYFNEYSISRNQVNLLDDMQNAIEQLNMESITLFMDFESPILVYSSYDYDNIAYSETIWNNLGTINSENANIYILSKKAIGFQSDEEFNNILSSYSEQDKKIAITDREYRNSLLENSSSTGSEWKLIYEDEYSYIFQKNL